jgi:hypothetical protein
MAQRTRSAPAERVKQLRERIDRWRSTRVKLWPMPAQLWDEATVLARELGVHRVQRALKLNYESLRLRVEEVEEGTSPSGSAEAAAEFVELSGAQLLGLPVAAGPVIELSDGNGVRLTVRLAAGSTLDMARLVEAFRGRQA